MNDEGTHDVRGDGDECYEGNHEYYEHHGLYIVLVIPRTHRIRRMYRVSCN